MSDAARTEGPAGPEPEPRGFWVGLAVGLPVLVFGIAGLISTTSLRTALEVASWVVGLDVVHDVLVAPLACVVGIGLAALLPVRWRAPVRAALFATSVATLVAYPSLRGFGRDTVPDNPTVQPLDYGTALLTVVGVIWVLAIAWIAGIALRRERVR